MRLTEEQIRGLTPLSNKSHLEFKKGDRFVKVSNQTALVPRGTIVTLNKNDGSVFPSFILPNKTQMACHWADLAPLPAPKEEEAIGAPLVGR
jgi:hypothetical protein